MSEAQALARSLYTKDSSISAKKLAEACGRSDRWARMELQKLKNGKTLQELVTDAVSPVRRSETPKEKVPTPEPKPIVKPSESLTAPAEGIAEAQPTGARLVSWLAFAMGLAASVAANVASVGDGIGSRVAAAFAPLAVLLAVEVLVRTRWQKYAWVKYSGLAIVAAVAAVVSYGHQRHLLLGYGESSLNATILPLAVDGLLTISATALIAMKESK